MYLLQLSNERGRETQRQGTKASEKKWTLTKVDDFDSKGLGSSYTWSYLADSSKEGGADSWA